MCLRQRRQGFGGQLASLPVTRTDTSSLRARNARLQGSDRPLSAVDPSRRPRRGSSGVTGLASIYLSNSIELIMMSLLAGAVGEGRGKIPALAILRRRCQVCDMQIGSVNHAMAVPLRYRSVISREANSLKPRSRKNWSLLAILRPEHFDCRDKDRRGRSNA